MKLFATQPTYLPWLGIFSAINWANEFVFWDDVQYERKSWQNHNVIRNNNGGDIMLTVPIRADRQQTLITEVEIADRYFYKKHLKSIELNYGGEPYTDHVVGYLREFLRASVSGGKLYSVTETMIQAIANYLELTCHFTRSTNYQIDGDKHTRPLNFAKHLGATDYMTQEGTRPYFNQAGFDEAGIKVHWLNIKPPNQYSIVDYMCRLTPEEIRKLL